jgi:hypothetical protein
MNRFVLSATIIVACIFSLPAVALTADGERPSVLARANLPQWPKHRPIKPSYQSLPEIALFSNTLLLPQPEALALRLPVLSDTPRLIERATPPKAKSGGITSGLHFSPHKPFFAHLKTAPPAPFQSRDEVFIGGLY